MKPGDIYNPEYIVKFLKNNSALRALATYTATWKAYADPNTHTVDVALTFFKGTAR
jgi:outer membrane protein insertion porin family